ncbi:MAG: acetyl-CoA carboxylase carboxyltransferase subunit beta [Alphaproteobacteria bacterium]|nr:acetyl-CoA carboxylase carboxyltransferase subunit beta [Alphaproteobacteria bacterium]
MNWLNSVLRPKIKTMFSKIKDVPENMWLPCPKCGTLMYRKDLHNHLNVCTKCDYHLFLQIDDRFESLFDNGKFTKVELNKVKEDPLNFKDLKKYKDRLSQYRNATKSEDAIEVAYGKVGGQETVIFAFNFEFMGGSMGTFVGEAIIKAAELAVKRNAALVAIPASGGARMQESMLSLMQMARTTMAINKVRDAGLPYIVIFANPTMGGVSASFAMLGDIHIAEKGALIGFAGKRVIEQTIKQKLPPEFQTAEYLKDQGMVDIVVHRKDLKETLAKVLNILMHNK